MKRLRQCFERSPIYRLQRCNRGATAVEFALLALPVFLFIFGIMQTAYIIWVDNLLVVSVNTAARCGAVRSTTAPCAGTDMISTANVVFNPLSGATFSANTSCPAGNVGLIGTYSITFVFVVEMTVTATSCYPSIPA